MYTECNYSQIHSIGSCAAHLVSISLVVERLKVKLSIVSHLNQVAATSITTDHAHKLVQCIIADIVVAGLVETIPYVVGVAYVLVLKEVLQCVICIPHSCQGTVEDLCTSWCINVCSEDT